jgi:hypothetical protein
MSRTFITVVDYPVFAPGDRVRARPGTWFAAGTFVVRSFAHPATARDEPLIELEGVRGRFDARHFEAERVKRGG